MAASRMPPIAAPTAIPAIAPVDRPPCALTTGSEEGTELDGELASLEFGFGPDVVGRPELDVDLLDVDSLDVEVLDADSRSDARWLIWNMGAQSVNSGLSVAVVVPSVMVIATGKVAWATATTSSPEHSPVGTTVASGVATNA
jgi:hypothetical protein